MVFLLSVNAPGDPVESMLNSSSSGNLDADRTGTELAYKTMRKKLNLDKPTFYFSLSTAAFPDSLHKIDRKSERTTVKSLVHQYGNWEAIEAYFSDYKTFKNTLYDAKVDSASYDAQLSFYDLLSTIEYLSDDEDINYKFRKMDELMSSNKGLAVFSTDYTQLKSSYSEIKSSATRWKHYVPNFHWYGIDNQYHKWITNFVTFDFGYSYQDRLPIADKIGDNIFWTFLMSIISIVMTYLLSIPLGVFSALKRETWVDGLITTLLFILYSLPSFWIAILMITFLCQSEYLDWFPSYGVGEVYDDMPLSMKFQIRASHLFLPIVCWTYGSLAFLSRQMRGGFIDVLSKDYIRTAKAKGLSGKVVVWKHAFKNSLLPIITMLASIFPAMISGSVVIEKIFSIPGMGSMMINAIQAKDFPVVFTVVMMSSILTMIGYLVADILYAIVDPRITFK